MSELIRKLELIYSLLEEMQEELDDKNGPWVALDHAQSHLSDVIEIMRNRNV